VPLWPRIPRGSGFFSAILASMNRVVFLIDGFNLYHAINENAVWRRFKWLDLNQLARRFLLPRDISVGVHYFTSLVTWNQKKLSRHRTYIRALETRGVHVVYGEFKRRDRTCRLCHQRYQTFEEKQTDVNIAIHLFRLSVEDAYDTAVLVSGDSDLIPSIRAVRQVFPSKQIRVVIPVGRAAEAMKREADFCQRMKEKHLRTSLLPWEIRLDGGRTISCPREWRE